MGLFDSGNSSSPLGGLLGQAGAAMLPVILGQVFGGQAGASAGGLGGIVDQLRRGGLGDVVGSWLGQGSNMPVSADQLRTALNNDQVRQLAEKFGIDPDAVLKLLAEHLPGAVDSASPQGHLPGDA